MRDLTLDETITAKHGYEGFLHLLRIQSRAIMLTTVTLQIKGSEMIACKTTRLSHFVVLEVIIRMALLKERSKILHSVLKQCYFTQKECFLGIFPLSFGLLR
jgi:hypothetical protein